MECNKCSKDDNLVFMENPKYNYKTGANSLECPKCKKKVITGFGRI